MEINETPYIVECIFVHMFMWLYACIYKNICMYNEQIHRKLLSQLHVEHECKGKQAKHKVIFAERVFLENKYIFSV